MFTFYGNLPKKEIFHLTGWPNLVMSLSLAPLEDLLDSLSLCYFVLIYFVTLYFRFIAERGASRLLEHVGQMDKIFKIPPPPGKTGVQSLRPLEENTPSPLAPVSQLGSVCFWCLCELGGALVETWRNSSDKFWLLRCCLFYSLRNVSSSVSMPLTVLGNGG